MKERTVARCFYAKRILGGGGRTFRDSPKEADRERQEERWERVTGGGKVPFGFTISLEGEKKEVWKTIHVGAEKALGKK